MATFLYLSPYETVILLLFCRNAGMRACEHGCLKQISLGPFPGWNFARKGP